MNRSSAVISVGFLMAAFGSFASPANAGQFPGATAESALALSVPGKILLQAAASVGLLEALRYDNVIVLLPSAKVLSGLGTLSKDKVKDVLASHVFFNVKDQVYAGDYLSVNRKIRLRKTTMGVDYLGRADGVTPVDQARDGTCARLVDVDVATGGSTEYRYSPRGEVISIGDRVVSLNTCFTR